MSGRRRFAALSWGERAAFAAVVVALIVLALGFAGGAIETPDVSGALSDATDSLGAWVYVAVAVFAFLETGAFVGLAVPGETAIVVGGVAAERGEVALGLLIALVAAAAVAGDAVSFLLGRRFGRPFLDRHAARFNLRPEQVDRVERYFARHGGKTVLVGRFIGILRALNPFVAGASAFPFRRFLPFTVVGAAGWAATFTLVGYLFAESFESSGETATRIALAAALLVGAALILVTRFGPRRRTRPGRRGPSDGGPGYEAVDAPPARP